MKVLVALALPAAALKPVPVTMSAQQGRRNFVIGGARAVQHSRLQKARGDNQHQKLIARNPRRRRRGRGGGDEGQRLLAAGLTLRL